MKAQIYKLFHSYVGLVERCSVPTNRIGLNVFRVLTGSLILLQYLLNYNERHFLLGPMGVVARELLTQENTGFSLYKLSNSPLAFDLLFHLGILVTMAWVLGFKTRLLTPLTYLFWFSLRMNNRFLWDGGDNLMQLLLVFACFADLSPLGKKQAPGSERSLWSAISGLLHNGAVVAFGLQLCFLYAVSGLTKVQGEVWQNGTALYYALWPAQFRFPGLSELLYADATLLALASYSTVFFQVAFPFLFCLNRYTRHAAVLIAVSFHLGIAGVMGLFTFAGFMIAADIALIDDEAYLRAANLARNAGRSARDWLQARLKTTQLTADAS